MEKSITQKAEEAQNKLQNNAISSKVDFRTFYENWIEEAKAIVSQTIIGSRMILIEGKWELGKHIKDNVGTFERQKIYGDKIIERAAKDLKMSKREIYYCLNFYEKYPAKKFEEVATRIAPKRGNALCWSYIKQKELTTPKTKEEEECGEHDWLEIHFRKCRKCGLKEDL